MGRPIIVAWPGVGMTFRRGAAFFFTNFVVFYFGTTPACQTAKAPLPKAPAFTKSARRAAIGSLFAYLIDPRGAILSKANIPVSESLELCGTAPLRGSTRCPCRAPAKSAAWENRIRHLSSCGISGERNLWRPTAAGETGTTDGL